MATKPMAQSADLAALALQQALAPAPSPTAVGAAPAQAMALGAVSAAAFNAQLGAVGGGVVAPQPLLHAQAAAPAALPAPAPASFQPALPALLHMQHPRTITDVPLAAAGQAGAPAVASQLLSQGIGGAAPAPLQGATAASFLGAQPVGALGAFGVADAVAHQLAGGAAGGLPPAAAPGALMPGLQAGGGGGVLPGASLLAHGPAPVTAQSGAVQAANVAAVGNVGLVAQAQALLQAQAQVQAQAQAHVRAQALFDRAGLDPSVLALAGVGAGSAAPIVLSAAGAAIGGGVAPAIAAPPLLLGVNAASPSAAAASLPAAGAGVALPPKNDERLRELRKRLAMWRNRGRSGLYWAFFEDVGSTVSGESTVSTVKCAYCPKSHGVYDVKKGWGGGPRRHVLTKHADLLLALKIAEGDVLDTAAGLSAMPANRARGGAYTPAGAGAVAAALAQPQPLLRDVAVAAGGANPTKAPIHATDGKVFSKRAEQYELLRALAARLAYWHRSGRTQAHWALYDDATPPAAVEAAAAGANGGGSGVRPAKRARRDQGAHRQQREQREAEGGGHGQEQEAVGVRDERSGVGGEGEGSHDGNRHSHGHGAQWARCAFCSDFAASVTGGAARLTKHARQHHPELLALVQALVKVDFTAGITNVGQLNERLGLAGAPAEAEADAEAHPNTLNPNPNGRGAGSSGACMGGVASPEAEGGGLDGGVGGGRRVADPASIYRAARPPRRRIPKAELRRANVELMAELLRRLSLWHAKKRVQTYWALFDLREESTQAPTVSTEGGIPYVARSVCACVRARACVRVRECACMCVRARVPAHATSALTCLGRRGAHRRVAPPLRQVGQLVHADQVHTVRGRAAGRVLHLARRRRWRPPQARGQSPPARARRAAGRRGARHRRRQRQGRGQERGGSQGGGQEGRQERAGGRGCWHGC